MKPAAGVPRKKEYKKGVDADDARRKREDNIIELRKNKRDENLQKKRMVNAGPSYAMEESSARTALALQNKVGASSSSRPSRRLQAHLRPAAPPARPPAAPSPAARPDPPPRPPCPPAPRAGAQQQLDELPAKVQGLYSQNPQDQYEATQWFRKLLSIGEQPGGTCGAPAASAAAAGSRRAVAAAAASAAADRRGR